MHHATRLLGCLLLLAAANVCAAQQVKISTPFQQLNNSFFEAYNINWAYNGQNPDGSGFFFNGPGPAPPPFGNYDPSGDARFGVGNGRFSFNFSAGQGNSATMTTEVPSVVVPNGHGGSISNTSLRPFVTGFIPVVGDCGTRHWVPGPFPILVTPKYPTFNYFEPHYTSPLGHTRAEAFQNVQQAQQQFVAKRYEQSKLQRDQDAKALAEERTRLRKRVKSGGSNDDPPLRLSDQDN